MCRVKMKTIQARIRPSDLKSLRVYRSSRRYHFVYGTPVATGALGPRFAPPATAVKGSGEGSAASAKSAKSIECQAQRRRGQHRARDGECLGAGPIGLGRVGIPESALGMGVAVDLLPPKRSLRTLAIVVEWPAEECGCEEGQGGRARLSRQKAGKSYGPARRAFDLSGSWEVGAWLIAVLCLGPGELLPGPQSFPNRGQARQRQGSTFCRTSARTGQNRPFRPLPANFVSAVRCPANHNRTSRHS